MASFAGGFGDTSASVGILIGLGGMYGRLLAQTLKSWSLMECVLSVTGLGAVLLASLVVT